MQVDGSNWPLVEVRWLDVASDEELTQFFVLVNQWLTRGTRFGLLLDSRGAQGLSGPQREKVIAWMRSHARETSQFLVQAVVFDNAIQRALYFGVHWAFAMPFPSKTFSSPEPARTWLRAQLDVRVNAA